MGQPPDDDDLKTVPMQLHGKPSGYRGPHRSLIVTALGFLSAGMVVGMF